MIRTSGETYYNPDEAAKLLRAANPDLAHAESNALAWRYGFEYLERAIRKQLDFAFETTLGGSSIADRLAMAAQSGIHVRIWYVGLASPALHIARVKARVSKGGHDIPEAKIRERYDASSQNLVRLLPYLAELKVFDNSADNDPGTGLAPCPRLLLHIVGTKVEFCCDSNSTPEWAAQIISSALGRAQQASAKFGVF